MPFKLHFQTLVANDITRSLDRLARYLERVRNNLEKVIATKFSPIWPSLEQQRAIGLPIDAGRDPALGL